MSQETTTLDQDLELETRKTSEQNAQLRSQRNTPSAHTPSSSPRNFGARMKDMFSNLAKALEGDQESHKFRS